MKSERATLVTSNAGLAETVKRLTAESMAFKDAVLALVASPTAAKEDATSSCDELTGSEATTEMWVFLMGILKRMHLGTVKELEVIENGISKGMSAKEVSDMVEEVLRKNADKSKHIGLFTKVYDDRRDGGMTSGTARRWGQSLIAEEYSERPPLQVELMRWMREANRPLAQSRVQIDAATLLQSILPKRHPYFNRLR